MMKKSLVQPGSLYHSINAYFICALSVLGFSGALHSETLYSTDFESFAVGQTFTSAAASGWTGNDNGSTIVVSISDKEFRSKGKSLYQLDQNSKAIPTASYDLGQTCTNAVVAVAVKLNTTFRMEFVGPDGAANFVVVHEHYAPAKGLAWELRDSKGTILNFTADSAINYKSSEWALLAITFNEANNSFNLSVNGTPAITATGGALEPVDWTIRHVRLMTGWYGGEGEGLYNYFDDFSVKTVAP